MNDWHVLDLDSDPTPGDPDRTRELARHLLHEAKLAENNTRRLRSVSDRSDALHMEGDYAPKYRDALQELPGALGKVGKAYRGCGHALSTFARSLEAAKHKAHTALRHGRHADEHYRGALREVRAAVPADRRDQFTHGLGPNDSVLEAAIADLDEHRKTQARHAAHRARNAEHDRDRAKRLASEAAKLRGDAERRCSRGIRDALQDSGIQDKSWWHKAWDAVSKPFRSWDAFVDLCSTIGMIVGTFALFISGPIGWALMAASVVAGAVVFGDALAKYAQGKGSLAEVGLSALSVIPFKPGALAASGLARGVSALATVVRSGQGTKLVGIGLRSAGGRLATAAKGAAGGAGRLGRQLGARAKSVMPWAKKSFRVDPVDIDSGRMVLPQTDVYLDGTLPLVLSRTHVSSHIHGLFFGSSWMSTLDQRLEVDDEGVYFASEDGLTVPYPHPDSGVPVLPVVGPRWPLERANDGAYTITDPDRGRTLRFAQYDPFWLLASITDRNGNRIDFSYDDTGLPQEISHSGGYRIHVETKDRLVTGLHLRGADNGADVALMRYGYRDERLTEVINESGQPMLFEYDHEGQITGWTDRNGVQYRYTYDTAGRCVRTEGSDGFMKGTVTYDTDNGVTYVTDSLGHRTAYHLNHSGQVIRQVNPLGAETVSEWDEFDLLLSRTDPLGRTTGYAYDEAGNLTVVRRPDGGQIQVTHNELRQPVTVTAPDGTVSRREYDDRGNLVRTVDPAGAATTYEYDDHGHLVSMTDALGNTRHVATNAAGLPIAITDPQGAMSRYERDAFGRVVAITDPVGGVTRFGWTIDGKPAWRTLPDGATEWWRYDAEGNLDTHIDALGQRTRTEVTHFDLPSAEVRQDGTRLEFGYDTELRLVSVTNEQGLVWSYDYDPAGNLVSETDFNDRTLTYCYDPAAQLIERTNGAGETTTFTRDLLGQVTERRSGDAVATFTYDAVGRLHEAANADARITFDRDPLGRVLAETINGHTLTSTYDALGRRTRRITPSGARSDWDHDGNDNPISLHTAGRTILFEHDAAGREIQRSLGNEAVLAQEWDGNHQLTSQALIGRGGRCTQQRAYRYRADGFLARIEDQLAGNLTIDLDQVGRVTAVQGAEWTERYAYDAAGNITDAAWPAPADSSDSETLGERAYSGTLIRRAGQVRYEHDAQGRMVLRQQKRLSEKPATWRYYWDAEDRMTGVVTPDGTSWRYSYDPLGRRVAKHRLDEDAKIASQVEFMWDGSALAEERTLTDASVDGSFSDVVVTAWDYEPETFSPVIQRGRRSMCEASQPTIDVEFYAIVTDLVGTPTELVGNNGEVAWRERETIWGSKARQDRTGAYIPLRFPGQYHDLETGLHYNHFRHYDPTIGRYRSGDPLGLCGGIQIHSYVVNSYLRLDPFGLASCKTVVENQAGRFGDMNPGPPGDGLTPHHIPQAALGFLKRDDGGAIVMKRFDHELTRTFGRRGVTTKASDAGLPFRDVAARDLWDMRRIGQIQYGDPSYYNEGITALLGYYRDIGML